MVYGEGDQNLVFTKLLMMGKIFKNSSMDSFYSKEHPLNTVHIKDITKALWKATKFQKVTNFFFISFIFHLERIQFTIWQIRMKQK